MPICSRVRSSSAEGMPKRMAGAPRSVSKCPSMAASLAGWWWKVLPPCRSPSTAWMGATMVSIHIAMENITRARGLASRVPSVSLRRSRSTWKAPTAPTIRAVVR